MALGHLAQPVAVGAGRAADDQHQVALRRHELYGVLAVLGGVADVLLLGLVDLREAPAQRLDDGAAVVHRQGGLGDVGQRHAFGHLQPLHVGLGLHQMDAVIGLTHGAFHLGVAGVADHDDVVAFLAHLGHFHVHLGDQRTGGVEDLQATTGSLGPHGARHAVGGKDHRGAVRHLVQLVDEDGALLAQRGDHVVVVDDLVTHVDGRAMQRQRTLDDGDGAIDAGAEAARLRQQNGLFTVGQRRGQQCLHVGLHLGRAPGPARLAVQVHGGRVSLVHRPHSEHPQQLHLEAHGLAGQRMVEVKERTSLVLLLQHARKAAAIRGGKFHQVAGLVGAGVVGQAVALKQCVGDALDEVGIALAEGLARRQFEDAMLAIGHSDEAIFQHFRHLADTQLQGGRLTFKGVDHIGAVFRQAQAVMQREKRLRPHPGRLGGGRST